MSHSIPSVLPQFVLDVAKRHQADYLVGRIEKKPAASLGPSRPNGTIGLLITLPSAKLSRKVRAVLSPLHAYACETASNLTNGGNFRIKVQGLKPNDGKKVKRTFRVPAEEIIFPDILITRTLLADIGRILREAEREYRHSVIKLTSGCSSKLSIPGEQALYFPRKGGDILHQGKYLFVPGRAYLVTLVRPMEDGKQAFTWGIQSREEFKAPVGSMVFQIPRGVLKQLVPLIEEADKRIESKLADHLAKVEASSKKVQTSSPGINPMPQPTRARRILRPRPSRGKGGLLAVVSAE